MALVLRESSDCDLAWLCVPSGERTEGTASPQLQQESLLIDLSLNEMDPVL